MLYYLFLLLLSPYVAWQDAPEAWQMGFQDPATPVMQGIIDLHDDICFFLIVILSLVLWMLIRTLYFFHETKNRLPEKIIHGTSIEIACIVAPSLILVLIAVPSFALLYSMDEVVNPVIELIFFFFIIIIMSLITIPFFRYDFNEPINPSPVFLKIKTTARQHAWRYQYLLPKGGIFSEFESFPLELSPINLTDDQLVNQVNWLVVPAGVLIKFITTSDDVAHSWSVGSLNCHCPAVPNYLHEKTTIFWHEGFHFGGCLPCTRDPFLCRNIFERFPTVGGGGVRALF